MGNQHVIKGDLYDEHAYQSACEDIMELRDIEAAGEEKSVLFPYLCQDVFHSLFKLHPRVREHVPSHLETHHEILSGLMETVEWAQLRESTRLDPLAAGIGTARLAIGLLEDLPEDTDEQRRRMRVLLRRATEELNELLDLAEGWGVESGPGGRTDLASARELARRIRSSARLKKIAELAGRMRRIAIQKHRTRVRHGADEICDVELGAEVSRLLPPEYLAMRHPGLRMDFLRRFSERQLLQYRLEGSEKLGRGPVIVCLDSSGSMAGVSDVWAKAVTLGLLAIAQSEGREFAVIHFGSASELRTWQFSGKPDPATLASCLDWFFGGGTDFETPLTEALGLVESSAFERADIVFITDGHCGVTDEFLSILHRRKQARGTRIYSVLIDADRASGEAVSRFSDGYEVLSDIVRDSDALDLVFSL